MENATKRDTLALIMSILILTENCLADKPIASYCLYTKKEEGSLKFESVIDSSIFAEMEERNRWQYSTEDEFYKKKYFVKVEGRNNMACSYFSEGSIYRTESISGEYNFLLKNMSLKVPSSRNHGSVSIGIRSSTHSSSSFERKSSSSLRIDYYPIKASTEFIIDFPDYNIEHIQDSTEINEIKSSFGNVIPVSWTFKIVCLPHSDTTITGSYFIRITRECPNL